MYQQELLEAKKLALKAGKIMRDNFSIEKQIHYKSDKTPVTEIDKQINRLVIKELTPDFSYPVIGEEESTADYGIADFWLCDPIDGTKAFIYGVPTFTFSLALIIDHKPVLGVIYDPMLDRLFFGVKGEGSYCGSTRLSVSSSKKLSGNGIAVGSDIKQIMQTQDQLEGLIKAGSKPISLYGAVYKLCLLAEGKIVGYSSDFPRPHDVAAGHVILEEAGGKLTDNLGKPLDYSKHFVGAVGSNGHVHRELLDILNS